MGAFLIRRFAMDKTYPKKTGITNVDDVVYYLEKKMEAIEGGGSDVLPPLPEEDGTYYLQLVIEDGEPGLVWEAET